jgi:pimeloyl-ACP methyl ester carboxylesterase
MAASVAFRSLRRARVVLGCVVGLVGLLTGCGAESPGDTSVQGGSVPSPKGDLYEPPSPLVRAAPGKLIWAEKVDLELDPPSTVWRILYHSRDRDDRDIAVSGFALVPNAPIPEGGRSVYAWGHGTAGVADRCAPSREVRENLPPPGGQQLERGAVVVATDYAGLGTPGAPTSTDGLAEGRAVLDSVRAVADLPNVGAIGDVVMAGHSQGGRAVLFAAEIAPKYASELNLVGVAAVAPGVELPQLVDHLSTSPFKGAVLIGAMGLRASHPDLDLSTVLTSTSIADLRRIERECVDATVSRYRSLATDDVITRAPSSVPEVKRLLEQSSPGASSPGVPVFIAHGDEDRQVPVVLSERLEEKYCGLDAAVARRVYRGQGHDEIIDAVTDELLAFISDRLDHKPATDTCGGP